MNAGSAGGPARRAVTEASGAPEARRRLVVVADSDSYVKWGAAFATRLPAGWDAELIVVTTPVMPSDRQLGAALAGSSFHAKGVRRLDLASLERRLAARRPDAVLLALRGPFVRVVAPIVAALPGRPVLLSGFPGLTIPAVPKAVVYREQVDLVVLHSRREVREFEQLAAGLGVRVGFGLATLPFLTARRRGASPGDGDAAPVTPHVASAPVAAFASTSASTPPDGDLVFAAQAKVPAERDDRVRMLGLLADAARRRPTRRVVVKVRARRGEAQTHAEAHDYADLLADPEVRARLGGVPPNLVVEDGPMAKHLGRASMLVTVSSTAVLEAVAAGVPAIVVDEFGVGPKLINTVFAGSGLFGDGAAVAEWVAKPPAEGWLVDNYFHGEAFDDWSDRLEELLDRRAAGLLPAPTRRHDLVGGAVRRAFERKRMLGPYDRSVAGALSMVVAVPTRWAVRRVRAVRRALPGGSRAGSSSAIAHAVLAGSMPADGVLTDPVRSERSVTTRPGTESIHREQGMLESMPSGEARADAALSDAA
ncbi:hypothetical protein PX701_03795 [Agromyces sp. H3Y2-19a]|uniref:DUF6716 putative glycosyltransferase n=1 Tax=Agromyces TaxID=33877 RepID=UPI001E44FAF0|nr:MULTISPECIES: DUF6716 putative glycosyltransferase [Agromyces]MCD5346374.1 hypothetical protein [Agromyces sp. S2-1-8]MDF0512738.1 hypothetical protein [Agromyces chromiiresistens]